MQNLWNALYEVVLDLKADQVITLVVMALFLAAGTSGVFRLVSRGKTEVTTILTSLVLVSTLLAMFGSAAYLRYTRPRPARGSQATRDGANRNAAQTASVQAADNLARLLMEYDTDHDGRLSAEEASAAASQFVTEISALPQEGKPGSVTVDELRRAIRRKMGPPPLFTP
jgi:hypothetical protein